MLIDFSFSKNSTSMKHRFRKKSFGVIVDMARYSMENVTSISSQEKYSIPNYVQIIGYSHIISHE